MIQGKQVMERTRFGVSFKAAEGLDKGVSTASIEQKVWLRILFTPLVAEVSGGVAFGTVGWKWGNVM